MKSNLIWSTTEQAGKNGWRLPTVNEARNYAINDYVTNKKFNYDFIQVQERTSTDEPMYVGLHNLLVEVSGVYKDMNLLCKGEVETSPPIREVLLKLYTFKAAKGHISHALFYGATIQDCITTFMEGKSIFNLGNFCRALGRDVAMKVILEFDHFFLNRLSVVLSADFHGDKTQAMELLEDAQFMQKLGWDVYEASIATKYGMTYAQAEDIIKWKINQSDYTQMLVHNTGKHEDIKKIIEESPCEDLDFQLQLFFTVLQEQVRIQKQQDAFRCRFYQQ